MVALILMLLFAAIVAISAIFGLIRGLNKSVIRLITLVVAAILTFVIAGPVTKLVAQSIKLEGQTLGEMILAAAQDMEMVGDILDAAPLLQEAILVVPAFVLSLVVFPVVFFLMSFVSWIVFLIVKKPLCKLIFREGKEDEDAPAPSVGVRVGKRFAGLGVGIVAGVLIFGMVVAPVLGLFSVLPDKETMGQTMDVMVEQEYLTAADADSFLNVYGVTDCPVVKFYGLVGTTAAGRMYINSVSKIEADGQTTRLADEFDSLLVVAQTAMEGGLVDALMAPEDQDALYRVLADEAFMNALMQDMFQSKLLRSAVPEVMAMAMENAAVGMNVPANKDAVYDNMMDTVALAVQNADIDYAGINAYEAANHTTYRIYRSASTGTTADGVMTAEEYASEVRKLEELTDIISFIIDVAVSGDNAEFADSVAACIVNEVKAQVSENGQDAIANFDAASVQSTIANISATDISAGEGDAEKLLEQLADKEKFETDVATVETIKETIRESVKDAMTDDATAVETASTLATIVSDFTAAISSATNEDGSVDITKLDYDKIANAVTTLQNSPLKDVGTSVLDMVVSGNMGNNSMVGNVLSAVKEGYENGEDIGGAIKTVGALIKLGAALSGEDEDVGGEAGDAVGGETGGNAGGETGGVGGETGGEVGGNVGGETGNQSGNQSSQQEAVVESLTSLIENLNEFTIGLLPSVFSTDTITSMGVPAEYADATYDVVETLLKELMKLQGAEDYTTEVNSILSLYDLATSGVEDFTEEDIANLVSYAVESDAIFNTLVSISHSNPFGIQIEDEAARADIVEAIEDHYAQSGKTPRERDIYNAVAALLGVDGEVYFG